MTVKTRAAKRKKRQRAQAHQQITHKPQPLIEVLADLPMEEMTLPPWVKEQVREAVYADQNPSRHPCPTCARSEKVTKKGLMSRHDYKAPDGNRKECPGTGRSFLVSEH